MEFRRALRKLSFSKFRRALREPSLSSILKVLAWLTIALSAMILAAAPSLLHVSKEPWQIVLPVTFAAAGVALTLAGHLFTQARDVNEAEDKRSLFYFESCLTAYEEAQALLEDENNDRATWIAAGRALGYAKELSRNITQVPHIRALELHRLKYRSFFYDRLQQTPAFFYGAKDYPTVPLNDAAAASTAATRKAGRIVGSTVNELPSKALHAVWEAAQWPIPFQDPLDADFTKQEEGNLMVIFPGLHEYLEHKRNFVSAGGKLLSRDSKD
jgi:hypothetical protein